MTAVFHSEGLEEEDIKAERGAIEWVPVSGIDAKII
jgi:hypothetical protein